MKIKTRIKNLSIFKKSQKISLVKKTIANIFLLSLTGIAILGISLVGKIPLTVELREGDISVTDIYAPFDFEYEWGIDKEKTEIAKQKAASLVLGVYTIDSKKRDEAVANINNLFNELKNSSGTQSLPDNLKELSSYEDIDKLRQVSISAINEIFSKTIVSESDNQRLISDNIKNITIESELDKYPKIVNVGDILPSQAVKGQLNLYINKNLDAPKSIKKILSDILAAKIDVNTSYNEKQTNAAKKIAEESIRPVYHIQTVKKSEIIVSKGERVTGKTLAKLSGIKSKTKTLKIFPFLFSFALILLLLFFILAIYITLYEPKALQDNTCIALVCALLFFVVAFAKSIILTPLPSYFIPTASISMLFALLISNTVVFPLIVITSVIISIMTGSGLNIFVVSFIGSTVGVFVVKRARRRSHLLKAGLYLGMSNFICIASWGILNELEPAIFLKESLWGVGGGIFASIITMFCLPIFERTFKLTSDIGLLELSDLNHPLLKKMATEAPGTYYHSLVVGNLAETACDAIGANSLLARVGAYYHDIGKIAKPEYFSENQPEKSKAHEDLTPHMSSLIITNHVKDGVDLARKHNLPKPIIGMIEQHHGSGLIYYFYQKALEKEQDEKTVQEEGFRYPGPKPQTKETAIILLADSVEAASRTLDEPTPAQLEELVRRIINNKFIDRQLDECELTLYEIDKIAGSFLRILIGIYHARVEYPAK